MRWQRCARSRSSRFSVLDRMATIIAVWCGVGNGEPRLTSQIFMLKLKSSLSVQVIFTNVAHSHLAGTALKGSYPLPCESRISYASVALLVLPRTLYPGQCRLSCASFPLLTATAQADNPPFVDLGRELCCRPVTRVYA